jgi:hypothetical protein
MIIKSNEVNNIMKMLFENNVVCIILPIHMPGKVYKHLTFVAELYFEHTLEFV